MYEYKFPLDLLIFYLVKCGIIPAWYFSLFLFLPSLSIPLLKSAFRSLKWGFLAFKRNLVISAIFAVLKLVFLHFK